MQPITCEVKASVSYLIALAEVYVIIGLVLFCVLLITIIRPVAGRSYHEILRVIRLGSAIAAYAVGEFLRTVFIYGQRLYMQAVSRKVKASIRYLISLADMNIIIGL